MCGHWAAFHNGELTDAAIDALQPKTLSTGHECSFGVQKNTPVCLTSGAGTWTPPDSDPHAVPAAAARRWLQGLGWAPLEDAAPAGYGRNAGREVRPSAANMAASSSRSLLAVVSSLSPSKMLLAPARKHIACGRVAALLEQKNDLNDDALLRHAQHAESPEK